MERNDHFPPKKTLNRFYAWTRRDPINKDTTTLSHRTFQFGITNSVTSPDFWYTGVLSLNLGTLHFLSLNLIHVQYCDIMRFMVLHNRHHKVSQSVPFFMHHKTVTSLSRIRVRGHFVMSNTRYHESHYVTVLDNRPKPPFSIRPEDYFKYLYLHQIDHLQEQWPAGSFLKSPQNFSGFKSHFKIKGNCGTWNWPRKILRLSRNRYQALP